MRGTPLLLQKVHLKNQAVLQDESWALAYGIYQSPTPNKKCKFAIVMRNIAGTNQWNLPYRKRYLFGRLPSVIVCKVINVK